MCQRQVRNEKKKRELLTAVLNSADHTLYRSATMRLCYLALDGPDLQSESKELARWMQEPTVGNMHALKRVARYLIGHGQLTQEFVRQIEASSLVVVFTDSDQAGCLRTNKSTPSTLLMVPTCYVPPAQRKESSRTWSSFDAQKSGSCHQQKLKLIKQCLKCDASV